MKTLALALLALTVFPAYCLAQKTEFVTVEPAVKLEVLDYGGAGRPLSFLAGLGSDAHVYDRLAPHFTASHHVLAI